MSDLLDTVKRAVGLAEDESAGPANDARAVAAKVQAAEAYVDKATAEAQYPPTAQTLEKQLPVTVWMRFGEMEAHAATVLHHAEQVAKDSLHDKEQELLKDMKSAMQAVRDLGMKIQDWAKSKP